MRKSRSNRAIRIFAAIAVPFLLWQALDWSDRPVFTVVDGSDGTITLQRQMPIRPGQTVMVRGLIQTQFAPATLVHGDRNSETRIYMDERTILEVKAISDDNIELFSTRGHWTIEPDRVVRSCTRAVCVETNDRVELYYYTPGEVVEVRPDGEATVTFRNETYDLANGDRMVIDELTDEVRLN